MVIIFHFLAVYIVYGDVFPLRLEKNTKGSSLGLFLVVESTDISVKSDFQTKKYKIDCVAELLSMP